MGAQGAGSTATVMRDTLFGDLPIERWAASSGAGEPWVHFARGAKAAQAGRVQEAVGAWREVAGMPRLESRHYLQAWNFLRANGVAPPGDVARDVLGVVVEVAMPDGLDLLAAYRDRTARYYNYSGAGVIWERPDNSMDGHVDALLRGAAEIAAKTGPWDDVRPPPPRGDHVRLNVLTPGGLHFGEAPMETMNRDPIGGAVFRAAAALMGALIQKGTPPGRA